MASRSGLSTLFGWLSVAAFVAATAPALFGFPGLQRMLGSPMGGVAVGFALAAWLCALLAIGAILATVGLFAAFKWKEPRTVSAVALALNLAPFAWFVGGMLLRRQ